MKRFLFIFGKSISAALGCVAAVFLIGLIRLNLLPGVVIAVAVGVLLAVTLLVLWLTWHGDKRIKMIFGVIIALLTSGALIIGTIYVHRTQRVIDKIFDAQTEVVHMAIYVMSDNADDYNDVAAEYCYGILQDLDRESTDEVLARMEETFLIKPNCVEYQRATELIDALLNDQVDAIILNQAYLDVLIELPEYQNILEQIREVSLTKVEVEIDKPTKPSTQPTDATEEQETVVIEPFCLYISGIDDYGPVNLRSCSDVNILAVVNPRTRQVLLISTPRDYYVPLTVTDGIPDKLTHGGIYGVDVSRDTIGMLYGIDIENHLRINFTGFLKIIDVIGGVTVYSEYAFTSHGPGGYSYQKGENTLNADMALEFCKERRSFLSGDRQRGKNQMEVIKSVINKLMSPVLLQNYSQILEVFGDSVDTNLSPNIISDLLSQQLTAGGKWNVVTYSVDGTGDTQVPYSLSKPVYVMQPDYETVEHAKELIQKVFNGEVISPVSNNN